MEKRIVSGLLVLASLAAGCGRDDKKDRGDFTLSAVPDLTVTNGQSAPVSVTVVRDHLDDEISVSLQGLPSGVTATAFFLEEDLDTGDITIAVSTTALHGHYLPMVVASAGTLVREVPLALLVRGVPGALDQIFGGDGTETLDFGSEDDIAVTAQVDGEGRATVAGRGTNAQNVSAAAARFAYDGGLDESFATGGKFFLDVTGGFDAIYDLEPAPGGGGVLLAFGEAGQDVLGLRIDADGYVDAAFGGGDGRLLSLFPNGDYAGDVVVASDGTLVFGGGIGEPGLGGPNYLIGRCSADGVLAPGFGGGDAWASRDIATSEDGASALLPSGDGWVLAGTGVVGADAEGALVRFDGAGIVDSSWGTGGQVILDLTANSELLEAAVAQQDGNLLVAGSVNVIFGGNTADWLIARYAPDGSLDATFGTGGVMQFDWNGLEDYGRAIALQPDGKILLAGEVESASGFDFGLLRLEANGQPDATFGTAGRMTVDFGGQDDFPRGLALATDGRIVVVGEAGTTSGFSDFGAARIWP